MTIAINKTPTEEPLAKTMCDVYASQGHLERIVCEIGTPITRDMLMAFCDMFARAHGYVLSPEDHERLKTDYQRELKKGFEYYPTNIVFCRLFIEREDRKTSILAFTEEKEIAESLKDRFGEYLRQIRSLPANTFAGAYADKS